MKQNSIKRLNVLFSSGSFSSAIILLLSLLFTISSSAQVTVAASTGANGVYATLSAAFTAINGSAQTGNAITITITANTAEPATGASLNSGTWTSITIAPSGGSRTISGTTNASVPLVQFNGADNVTINGGSNLTFSNAQTNAGFTFYFINDAKNNNINNCTILSANAMTGSAGGTINFSSGSSTGNNNNTITACNIGPTAPGTLPALAIVSGSAGIDNSSNTVSNCNIYDYFNATSYSAGIYISGAGATWTISGNRFYQTASRSYTSVTAAYNSGILLVTSGNGFTIQNNIIGYNSSASSGTYTITDGGVNAPKFSGIDISVSNGGTATTVTNNTITAISLTTFIGSAQITSASPFLGIVLRSGNATIGGASSALGNTIGNAGINGAIAVSVSAGAGTAAGVVGIGTYLSIAGNPGVNVLYNSITSFSCTGTANIRFSGINSAISTASVLSTINYNTIGGTSLSAGAIINTSAGSGSNVHGMDLTGIQAASLFANTIRNMSVSAANANGATTASAIGIMLNSSLGASSHTLQLNIIHSLYNTNSGSPAVWVMGIYMQTSASASVSMANNFVHSLSLVSTDVTATIAGMVSTTTSPVTYTNNMIRLGIDGTGASITVPCVIYGIHETANNVSGLYFNSIYIGGTGVTGTPSPSAAYNTTKSGVATTVAYNIFDNQRNSGGTGGPHVGIQYASLTGWTFNYNLYWVPNTTGTATAGWAWARNTTPTNYTVFTTWQAAITPFEANSVYVDPGFTNPTGNAAAVDLHINCPPAGGSFASPSVVPPTTLDFDLDVRSTNPREAGADEFVGSTIYSLGVGTCGTTTTVTTFTCGSTSGNAWAYFLHPTTKKVVAAINPNGSNLGTVTVTMYDIDSSFAALQSYTDHSGFYWNYLNKIWTITASGTITPGSEPSVRFYYTPTEMTNFRNAAAVGCGTCDPYSDQDLVLLQATGLTEDCNASNNLSASAYNFYWYKDPTNYTKEQMHIQQFGLSISAPTFSNTVNYYGDIASGVGSVVNTSNTQYNGRYFQATVPSFSEFRLMLPPQRILPVKWFEFTAQLINEKVRLKWSATETENVLYDVERAADGINFSKIGSLPSAGTLNIINNYNSFDNAPVSGRNYYRIKVTTGAGKISYSNTVLITLSGVKGLALQLYPNPVQEQLQATISSNNNQNAELLIFDARGKLVQRRTVTLINGNNKIDLNTTQLPSGNYWMQLKTASGELINKSFIKL